MPKETKIDHETLLIMAENAVAGCEGISPGGLWASICEEADVAIENLRGDGIDALGFTQLKPAPVGVLIDISALAEHAKAGTMVESLAALHSQALRPYPEFAQAVPWPAGLDGLSWELCATAAARGSLDRAGRNRRCPRLVLARGVSAERPAFLR